MQLVSIQNVDIPFSSPIEVVWCNHFFCKLKGLMLRKDLPENEGILFVNKTESILDSSIHMLFMRFDIYVVWLNSNYDVVDTRIAKKWQPFIFPNRPARYVLELNSSMDGKICLGTKLIFNHV
jgi:uncharacterized membrane protein (UPF0127 family)